MRRFWHKGLSKLQAGDSVELDRAEASHLFKTLRAEPGFELGLLDGEGREAFARVGEGRAVHIVDVKIVEPPRRKVHLFIAPPRRQRMDQILRQSAELGVWTIQPMLCERSVSEPDEGSVAGRWEDVLAESCKQSGNPFLPRAQAPLPFAKALDKALAEGFACFYGAVSGASAELDWSAEGDFAWFVGPEGGFSPAEEDALRARHARPLRVGRCVLRVETAAICGLALLAGCRN